MSEWLFLKDVACWNLHVPMLHLQSWEVGDIAANGPNVYALVEREAKADARACYHSDAKFMCVGYLIVRDEILMMLFV